MRVFLLPVITLFCLTGCLGYPDSVTPVDDFVLDRYLGQWYEIARLDHSFEKGLEQVTATYSLRDDGGVRVINRGYSPHTKRWQTAEGKAFFVQEPDIGYFKVAFFGPFYGSYVVFELDKDNYQYAFIAGANHSYLWFLSRTPTVSEELMARFIHQAQQLGFNTAELIYVRHE